MAHKRANNTIRGNLVDRAFVVFNYILLTVVALIMLYPIWYVLMYSLSEPTKMVFNNYYIIPSGFTLETYKFMIAQPLILTGFKNSIFVTGAGTVLAVLMTFITAYPLAQNELKGKNVILKLIFFTMLFEGGMIPKYMVVRMMGLTDSLWSLIILGCIQVYYLLIMIRFIRGIPQGLIDAAQIDGCNDVGILFKIILPLSKAALASIALFYAVGSWNSYLGAIIYISDNTKMVLQVVLRTLFKTESLAEQSGLNMTSTPEHFRMTTIIITALPMLIIYPFIQKYFIKGVTIGALKG